MLADIYIYIYISIVYTHVYYYASTRMSNVSGRIVTRFKFFNFWVKVIRFNSCEYESALYLTNSDLDIPHSSNSLSDFSKSIELIIFCQDSKVGAQQYFTCAVSFVPDLVYRWSTEGCHIWNVFLLHQSFIFSLKVMRLFLSKYFDI